MNSKNLTFYYVNFNDYKMNYTSGEHVNATGQRALSREALLASTIRRIDFE